jgi:hypothetical protein
MNVYLKLIVVLSLSLLSKFSYSQTTADFIGEWKIITVELSAAAGEEEKQMLAMLRPIFLKSMFHFKADNSFSFASPDKELAIEDGVWQFDVKKQYLKVMERMSKGTPGQLMGITVNEANGGYLFHLEETPVILTVIRKI